VLLIYVKLLYCFVRDLYQGDGVPAPNNGVALLKVYLL